MSKLTFTDPLRNFDWAALYACYDEKCRGFNPSSPMLSIFNPVGAQTDRLLYYKLTEAFRVARSASVDEAAAIYKATLYWKLYSQHQVRGKIANWANAAAPSFHRLVRTLPATVERRPDEIVKLLADKRFVMPGMTTGIAVRATVLHFLYPDVSPLFDRMVLRAVGIESETASKDFGVFQAYTAYAWSLGAKYRQECSQFTPETPLRVIDMALWANRGGSSALPCSPLSPSATSPA